MACSVPNDLHINLICFAQQCSKEPVTFHRWEDWDWEMLSNLPRMQWSSQDLTVDHQVPNMHSLPCTTHPCLSEHPQPRQQQLSLCFLTFPAMQDMASLQESGETCLERAASLLNSNAAGSKAHKCLPPWAGNFSGPDEVRKRSHECVSRIIFLKPVPAEG